MVALALSAGSYLTLMVLVRLVVVRIHHQIDRVEEKKEIALTAWRRGREVDTLSVIK